MSESVSSCSAGQSADLRTRIAAVLYRQHYRYGNPNDITWDELEADLKDRYLADADAVIRELRLCEELVSGVPFNGVWQRRIISDWETFNSSEDG